MARLAYKLVLGYDQLLTVGNKRNYCQHARTKVRRQYDGHYLSPFLMTKSYLKLLENVQDPLFAFKNTQLALIGLMLLHLLTLNK